MKSRRLANIIPTPTLADAIAANPKPQPIPEPKGYDATSGIWFIGDQAFGPDGQPTQKPRAIDIINDKARYLALHGQRIARSYR